MVLLCVFDVKVVEKSAKEQEDRLHLHWHIITSTSPSMSCSSYLWERIWYE